MFKSINYIHFDTIDSTNTWAKSNARNLDPEQFTCITALEQTAGHGRFMRKWLSPRGQNIYATLFFGIPKENSYLSNLGQVLAYSCALVLKEKGFPAQIKWPNDILIDGKKIAGILSEAVTLPSYIGMALGIGINVNMTEELLSTINQPATSLAQLSQTTWKLEQVLEPLLQQFLGDLEKLKKKGFSSFHTEFNKLLAHKGKEISCHDGTKVVKGICQAITKEGHLELLLASGKTVTMLAGELKFN